MTLGTEIRALVEQLMLSAKIDSPRFDDYRIREVGFYADTGVFDATIAAEMEKALNDLQIGNEPNAKFADTEEDTTPDFKKMVNFGMGGNGAIVGLLGKLLPPVAVALIVKEVAAVVLEELIKPGGVFDTRYKRRLSNEIENYLSRQTQRDTQVGVRQVVIQANNRFLTADGSGNNNTFRQIRESGTRVSEVGLHVNDRAKGLERYLP